jgi:hypothetical protein
VGRRRRAPRSLSEPISSPVGCTLQSNPGCLVRRFVRRRCCVYGSIGWNSMKAFSGGLPLKCRS